MKLSILQIKKLSKLMSFYLIPSFALLVLLYDFIFKDSIYGLVIAYGNYAFITLLFTLMIKPLSVIFNKRSFFKKLLMFRQELGIITFWFAMFHSIALILYLDLFSIQSIILVLNLRNIHIFSGLFAMIGIFILGVTSNKISRIKLKKNWKKIHYIIYPTLFLVCIHKYLSEAEFTPFVIFGFYSILKIIELVLTIRVKSNIYKL